MEDKRRIKKRDIFERIGILLVVLAVIALLVYFISDVFFPFIKAEISGTEQAKQDAQKILEEKGFLGYATVSLVEALQMVVVFIPAEFIQLTSGMAYSWWVAVICLDIGVIIGSSIIYLLVNIFRFSGTKFNKNNRIEQLAKMSKNRSTIILMLLLFIMPIIPFGAICYFGSGKKVPYWKYVLTCAVGVLPSIFTSIFMGWAINQAIAYGLAIWAMILIIVGCGAFLFILLLFVLNKFFLKQNDYTPFSVFYGLIVGLVSKLLMFKVKYKFINREALESLDGPYILLANHHCWFDFLGVHKLDKYRHYAMVANNYYFNKPIIGKWFLRAGAIPKKLFTTDVKTIMKIMKAKNDGFPIAMFPEARLSTDGGRSLMNPGIAPLVKKLDIPVVLVQLRKGYFIKPKWRKKMIRGRFDVEVKRVIQIDELEKMNNKEVLDAIEKELYFNEFDYTDTLYKSKHKAEGLEHILYRCPHCGAFYSNETKGNKMVCKSCLKEYEINNNYQFTDKEVKNIHDYYALIKEAELNEIDHIDFDIEVDTKIFDDKEKKPVEEKGRFIFNNDKVRYESKERDFSFEYKINELEGIAYSVNEEFEMYYENKLYYFYPTNIDKSICTRIALVFELLKEKERN